MDTLGIELCERGLIPDAVARAGMRRLIGGRLTSEQARDGEARNQSLRTLIERASTGPIAQHTADANAQHYELPAGFFEQVLGPHFKYSGCLFDRGVTDLAAAEGAMLACCAERAELQDGQRILDLGCGWGSFALWAAARYPNASILAVSNSNSQREFIDSKARTRGLANLTAQTCDINEFAPGTRVFDRIVSIEMFEHMRNYRELMARIAEWLAEDGRLFVHIFCHKLLAYPFSTGGDHDWMGRYFFTGGVMPSENLLLNFQNNLVLHDHWWVSGSHYEATAKAWLTRMDANRDSITRVFSDTYGADTSRWFQRWRMFFMAVAELFGYRDGNEWGIGHYLFAPRQERPL